MLEEDATRYIRNPTEWAFYMIEAFDTTPGGAERLVAGTHPFDRTIRPQLVNELNPGYRDMIRRVQAANRRRRGSEHQLQSARLPDRRHARGRHRHAAEERTGRRRARAIFGDEAARQIGVVAASAARSWRLEAAVTAVVHTSDNARPDRQRFSSRTTS